MSCEIINLEVYRLRMLCERRISENFPRFTSINIDNGIVYFYNDGGFAVAQLHECTMQTLLGMTLYNKIYDKYLSGFYSIGA